MKACGAQDHADRFRQQEDERPPVTPLANQLQSKAQKPKTESLAQNKTAPLQARSEAAYGETAEPVQ